MTTSKPVRLMSELRRAEATRDQAAQIPPGTYTLEALERELERAVYTKVHGTPPPDRRLFKWERDELAAAIGAEFVASRERRRRRLSVALWVAIVALSAVVLAVTYHRCFGH